MTKRKIIRLLLAFVFIVSGISFFIYPRITDRLYKSNISSLEKIFEENINVINDNDDNNKLSELYDILSKENINIYNNHQRDFLSEESLEVAKVNLRDYGLIDNIFGFIEIPSINIILPIYFGASNENMRLGATQLTGTSYPIGGENTNSVIAAHRGFYKTEMFRNIDKIQIGDKLYIKNPFDILEYEAINISVIKPNELEELTIQEGNDMITIISCHPFPHNYQRYVVYFKRV